MITQMHWHSIYTLGTVCADIKKYPAWSIDTHIYRRHPESKFLFLPALLCTDEAVASL